MQSFTINTESMIPLRHTFINYRNDSAMLGSSQLFSLSISLCALGFRFCTGQNEFGKTIGALLNDFNSPLKITIIVCWEAEHSVKFVRNINDRLNLNENDFQIKVTKNDTVLNAFDRHQEVIIVDVKCYEDILPKLNRQNYDFVKVILFDSNVQELNYNDFGAHIMDEKIQKIFYKSPILPMSQIFYLCRVSDNKFIVKQAYRSGLREPLILEKFAHIDGEQFIRPASLTPVIRRRNMKGLQLRASMVILYNESLNHLDDYRDIHLDAISRSCYQLTKHLITFINGTTKYSIVPTWGYKNETTGEWNGMMGELLRDEADIAVTPFFFTVERVAMMEYISCPTSSTGQFIFRAPKLSYTNNLYSLPFERLLWMCLVLLVLVIALCLCGAMFLELKFFSSSEIKYCINDAPLIIFGALCQQGSSVVPRSITAKIIVAIAFIILMFLFVSYSANIVALLQSPSNQIKTLQDLYESKLEAAVEGTVYNRHYFPREKGILRKNFYEHKLRNKDGTYRFITLNEGIKKVREGLFAFYSESSSAYKVISETFLDIEKCGLQVVKFFEMNVIPWYAIQKNSSYKEVLKIGMMRINEHGIQQREDLRYYMRKPQCMGGGGNFVSATLVDTGPVILILLWGILLTVVIFICELIFAHSNDIRHKIFIIKRKIGFSQFR